MRKERGGRNKGTKDKGIKEEERKGKKRKDVINHSRTQVPRYQFSSSERHKPVLGTEVPPLCVELLLALKVHKREGVTVRTDEHGNDLFSGPETSSYGFGFGNEFGYR
jgi:hypothetical protein